MVASVIGRNGGDRANGRGNWGDVLVWISAARSTLLIWSIKVQVHCMPNAHTPVDRHGRLRVFVCEQTTGVRCPLSTATFSSVNVMLRGSGLSWWDCTSSRCWSDSLQYAAIRLNNVFIMIDLLRMVFVYIGTYTILPHQFAVVDKFTYEECRRWPQRCPMCP